MPKLKFKHTQVKIKAFVFDNKSRDINEVVEVFTLKRLLSEEQATKQLPQQQYFKDNKVLDFEILECNKIIRTYELTEDLIKLLGDKVAFTDELIREV